MKPHTKHSTLCLCILFLLVVSRYGFPATYYVSNSQGDDSNPGSLSLPWKTLGKVGEESFNGGDQVLFMRGDTWRETLFMPSTGDPGNFIYFGAYGSETERPRFSGADLINESSWSIFGSGIYRTALPNRCWISIVDGEYAQEADSISSMNLGEWKWENGYLYFHGNPFGKTIEAGQRLHIIVGTRDTDGDYDYLEEANSSDNSRFTVDGFKLEGSNSSAILVRRTAVRPIKIMNNLIQFCNSSHSDSDPAAGIQLFGVSSDSSDSATIKGNTLRYLLGEGVRLTKCSGIEVIENHITQIRRGHNIYGDAIQITSGGFLDAAGNDFKLIGNYIDVSESDTGKGAIQIEGVEQGLIAENTIHYGRFGVGLNANDVVLKNNVFSSQGMEPHEGINEGWPAAIRIGGTLTFGSKPFRNVTIHHNIIYGARNHGIQIVRNNERNNFNIVHNTIFMSGDGFTVEDGGSIDGLLANNIFWTNANPDDDEYMFEIKTSGNEFVSDYNIYGDASLSSGSRFFRWNGNTYSNWQGFQTAQSSNGFDQNSLSLDPLFVDSANGFFTPVPGSPAQDGGTTNLAVATSSASFSSELPVDNVWLFDDGRGLIEGDLVSVNGSSAVEVLNVDYATGILSLAEARSWTSGDFICFAYSHGAPDMGAIEQTSLSTQPLPTGAPGEWIIDNQDTAVSYTSNWETISLSGQFGTSVADDKGFNKGGKLAVYSLNVPSSGQYDVYMSWPEDPIHAPSVPITINHADGSNTITINQQANGGAWNYLGTFMIGSGDGHNLKISNADTHGYHVVADAVRLVPLEPVTGGYLIVEAEDFDNSTESFAPFTVQSEASASGGAFIGVPNGVGNSSNPSLEDDGLAIFSFSVGAYSDITVWARVDLPTGYDNSFHYRLDSGNWEIFNNGTTNGWEWVELITYPSISGMHEFSLKRREDGARIDKLYLTSDLVKPVYILDNEDSQIVYTSNWDTLNSSGQFGGSYVDDKGFNKGGKFVDYPVNPEVSGLFTVSLWWPYQTTNAPAVPVEIHHAGGVSQVTVDQQQNASQWVPVGDFDFTPGGGSYKVVIGNSGTHGYHVVADAIRFERTQ